MGTKQIDSKSSSTLGIGMTNNHLLSLQNLLLKQIRVDGQEKSDEFGMD